MDSGAVNLTIQVLRFSWQFLNREIQKNVSTPGITLSTDKPSQHLNVHQKRRVVYLLISTNAGPLNLRSPPSVFQFQRLGLVDGDVGPRRRCQLGRTDPVSRPCAITGRAIWDDVASGETCTREWLHKAKPWRIADQTPRSPKRQTMKI